MFQLEVEVHAVLVRAQATNMPSAWLRAHQNDGTSAYIIL